MSEGLRLGVLGTGNIARQFIAGARASRRCRIAAVGSRQVANARLLADEFAIERAHGNYTALIDDATIEAVYIALPNALHFEWTIRALHAGKHVLCEKPLAVRAEQAKEMFATAEREGKRLIEAVMYRSHPQTRAILELLHRGEIGDLKMVRTSFCLRTRKPDGNVRFQRELAGGALLDVGCYCVDFSRLVMGEEPSNIVAAGHLWTSGVDDFVTATLSFPSGRIATFQCALLVQADNTAMICGTDGFMEIPVPWKPASQSSISVVRMTPPRMDGAVGPTLTPARSTYSINAGSDVYAIEVDHFATAILDNAPPAILPHDSIANATILDTIRQQIGLSY
jgi:predicted dehydrogenase